MPTGFIDRYSSALALLVAATPACALDVQLIGTFAYPNGAPDQPLLLLHYEYFNEAVAVWARNQVGWLAVRVSDPQRLDDVANEIDALYKNSSDPTRTVSQDEYSRAQAVEMAQRAEVIIYAISTDDSGLLVRGDKVLEQLAEATGGRAFFPYKMKDVTRSFTAIEDELRSQYVVSYRPADFDADGRFRAIEISALKKDLQVRARKGYFAPKQ